MGVKETEELILDKERSLIKGLRDTIADVYRTALIKFAQTGIVTADMSLNTSLAYGGASSLPIETSAENSLLARTVATKLNNPAGYPTLSAEEAAHALSRIEPKDYKRVDWEHLELSELQETVHSEESYLVSDH